MEQIEEFDFLNSKFFMATDRMFKYFVIFGLFALLIILSVYPVENPDIWAHLKVGEQILETGKLVQSSVFLSSVPEGEWLNADWLSRVTIYKVYDLFGANGIIIFKVIILVGILALLLKAGYYKGNYLILGLLGLLVIFVAQPRFSFLPHLFSLLFICVYFFILSGYQQARSNKLIWLLPIFQVLWVNMHLYFFLGLVLIFSFFIGNLIIRKSGSMLLLWVGIVSILSCFINPTFSKQALGPLNMFFQLEKAPLFMDLISELQPLFSKSAPITNYFFYCKLFIFVCGLSFLLNIRKLNLTHLIIYFLLLYMTIRWQRNIDLLAFIGLPIMAINLSQGYEQLKSSKVANKLKEYLIDARVLFNIILCLFILAAILDLVDDRIGVSTVKGSRRFALGISDTAYPKGAVDFIEKVDLAPNVFNNYELGGYFTWRMYPKKKAFVDSNVDFREQVFIDYVKTLRLELLPDKVSSKYGINYFLLMHTYPDCSLLIKHLYKDDLWKLIYLDGVSAIFIKDSSENNKVIQRYKIDLQIYKESPVARDFSYHIRRGDFFELVGNFKFAEIEFEKAHEIALDNSEVLYRLGSVYFRKGLHQKSKDYILQAIHYNKSYFGSFYLLGLLLARENNFRGAAFSFNKAARLNPEFADAHYNLAVAYSMIHPPKIGLSRRHVDKAIKLGYSPKREFLEHLERLEKKR